MRPELEKELAALAELVDEDVDVSDVPETLDWSTAVRGRFYRPKKQPISIRLDVDVLHWLRSLPGPYTTRINEWCRTKMLGALFSKDLDHPALIEELLSDPTGRALLIEIAAGQTGRAPSVPRTYRFDLFLGRDRVFSGESVEPAARADVLAAQGLKFDRVVVHGDWSADGSDDSENSGAESARRTG